MPGGTEAPARTSVRHPAPGALERLPWLLTLLACVLSAFAYPLNLSRGVLDPLVEGWRARAPDSPVARFCLEQFHSILAWEHSPLPLKGALAMVCLTAMVFVSAAALLIRGTALRGTGTRGPGPAGRSDLRGALAWASLPVFAIWCAVTAAWSPTPGVSIEAVPWLWGGAAAGYVLLRGGVSAGRRAQFSLLIVLLASLLAAVSLLQAASGENGLIHRFLYRFNTDADSRNAYGSLIGHNTHLASFLLMALFPAFALLLTAAGRFSRIASLACVCLAVPVIVITRSRAIWILSPILVSAFLFLMHRRPVEAAARRSLRRLGVALGLLVGAGVLSQTVRADWNPFREGADSFVRRFRLFQPEVIREGTRVRILVCSGPLLREAPWLGHGFQSFRYVYPLAQAEWFADHPETRLGATLLRTERAHNDYLQVWIESGAIGVLLLLLVLAEIFLRGRASGACIRSPVDSTTHAAAGFAALAVTLHALVDFPFRLPMLAVPWLVCAAAYGSTRAGADSRAARRTDPAASGKGEEAASGEGRGAALRWRRVYRLVNAFFIVLLIPFFTLQFVAAFQADMSYMRGQSGIERLRISEDTMPLGERRRIALDAEEMLIRATTLRRNFDLAWFSRGMLRASLGYMQYEDEVAAGAVGPGASRPQVNAYFAEAKSCYEAVLRTLPFHDAHREIARCHEYMWSFSAGAARKDHAEGIETNLRKALYIAPAFAEAAHRLDQWLSARGDADPSELLALRRGMIRYNPAWFRRAYTNRFEEMLEWGDYAGARAGAGILLDADPSEPSHLGFALEVFMALGETERVLEICERLRGISGQMEGDGADPYHSTFANLYEAAVRKDWAGLLAGLDSHGRDDPRRVATLAVLERAATEADDRLSVSSPPKFGKPEGMSEEAWARLLAEEECRVRFRVLHDPESAMTALRRIGSAALSETDPRISIEFAWLAARSGDAGLLSRLLDLIGSEAAGELAEPGHPARTSMAELSRTLESWRETPVAEPSGPTEL